MTKNEKLFGEGWARAMRPFLESQEFTKIIATLSEQHKAGKKILPDFYKVFAPFRQCPYDDVFVMWLMKLPYQGRIDNKMYMTIETEIAKQTNANHPHFWSMKNVLSLPINLTSDMEGADHTKLWEPFIDYVFKVLHKQCVIYLLVGKEAHQYDNRIDVLSNDYYYVEHPVNAILKNRSWKTFDIFNRVNLISKVIHNQTIWHKQA